MEVADKLAKRGVLNSLLRTAADEAVKSAGNALLHVAARLGVVTLAANQHRTEFTFTKENVEVWSRLSRDSTPMPAAVASEKQAKKDNKVVSTAPQLAPRPLLVTAAPLAELTTPQRKQKERRRRATESSAAHETLLANAVASTAASSESQPISASDRMAALRNRRGLSSSAQPSSPGLSQ